MALASVLSGNRAGTLWGQSSDCVCLTVALACQTLLKHVSIVSTATDAWECQNPRRIGSTSVSPALPTAAKLTVAVSMPNPARNVSRVGDRLISNRQGVGRFEHTVILHLAKLLTAVATQPVVSEPVVDVASAYPRVSCPFSQ